jgi:hypothetical protein
MFNSKKQTANHNKIRQQTADSWQLTAYIKHQGWSTNGDKDRARLSKKVACGKTHNISCPPLQILTAKFCDATRMLCRFSELG